LPYYVYQLTNKPRGTLYVGVTRDLASRVWQHRIGAGSEFAWKYKLSRLVHVESFADSRDAIQREKRLKEWQRQWKIELIEASNPDWRDLYDDPNL